MYLLLSQFIDSGKYDFYFFTLPSQITELMRRLHFPSLHVLEVHTSLSRLSIHEGAQTERAEALFTS